MMPKKGEKHFEPAPEWWLKISPLFYFNELIGRSLFKIYIKLVI
jgi:hypothetical protein